MTTHTEIPHGSFLKDNALPLAALTLGIVAILVGLFLSFVIGGLLGLVTWAVAAGARSTAKTTGGPGYAIAIVAAVLGAIAIAMLLLGGILT